MNEIASSTRRKRSNGIGKDDQFENAISNTSAGKMWKDVGVKWRVKGKVKNKERRTKDQKVPGTAVGRHTGQIGMYGVCAHKYS